MTSIEKLKMVVNSFDSGDVLVKNNSTTLFHTSYKDNGIAVRSSKGEYNAATGATGFTFDFQKMPAAIKDLRAGDMVLQAYVCPVC